MSITFLQALKLNYESEIAKAKANIDVYITNPAGIGEHPDIAQAIDSQIKVIAENQDKLSAVNQIIEEG